MLDIVDDIMDNIVDDIVVDDTPYSLLLAISKTKECGS